MKNLLFVLCLQFILVSSILSVTFPDKFSTLSVWFGLFALVAGIASRIEEFGYHRTFHSDPRHP